jgi:hypothetical protein
MSVTGAPGGSAAETEGTSDRTVEEDAGESEAPSSTTRCWPKEVQPSTRRCDGRLVSPAVVWKAIAGLAWDALRARRVEVSDEIGLLNYVGGDQRRRSKETHAFD